MSRKRHVLKGAHHHCVLAEDLHLVMAHRRAATRTVQWVQVPGFLPSSGGFFQADIARAFQMETGYVTSAIALTNAYEVKFELDGLGDSEGASAVVFVMQMDSLIKFWSGCDWQNGLLRFRNSLADQGSKLFVALATQRDAGGVIRTLTSLWSRLFVNTVKRYCREEGIGFLGSVRVAVPIKTRQKKQPDRSVATILAQRLASTSHFCCGAFRIGG